MVTKLYDNSGFELSFEDEIPESERKLYLTIYPTVDKVAERRIHCTSCNAHIGTAPNAEAKIRMHPILRVTHCRNCHSFYNSGEFDKGEDGSELYCRWCGQGGEVYCCSNCPYVFCKKCIVQNFSRSMITEIERQDNWECFNCSPQILFNLRAQHWALMNFIEKQTKEILNSTMTGEEKEVAMAKDSTTCCRRKSNVVAKKRPSSPVKYPAKKPPEKEKVFRASELLGGGNAAPSVATRQQPVRAAALNAASNLVCAPDILSMFSDDAPDEPPSVPPAPRVQAQVPQRQVRQVTPVPPLAIRQYVGPQATGGGATIRPQAQVRSGQHAYVAGQPSNIPMVQISSNQGVRPGAYQRQPQAASGAPVYHTINGYRIDLNTAAQQETFRLPNGKLIQVKKQAPTSNVQPVGRTQIQVEQRAAVPINNSQPYAVRYQQPVMPVIQQQQRVLNGGQTQIQLQQNNYAQPQFQQLQPNQVRPNGPQIGLPLKPPPTLLQKPCHPPTPLGIARNAFEFKVYNSLEVCHQIIGKINTLSNYPSYKTVKHVSELKDLYTHLSYLLTYAIGRFKSVQDKCAEESKLLGLEEEKNKPKDDELEVIEKQTLVIDLEDSDDESGPSNKQTTLPLAPPKAEVRPSTSSSSSDSIPVIMGPAVTIPSNSFDIEDPKLKMIPRVEILKAETLIPSVEQLLKHEIKKTNETMSSESAQTENNTREKNEESEDEPISNLFEVTPDISVMMDEDDDAESDKDSLVEIVDSPASDNGQESQSQKEPDPQPKAVAAKTSSGTTSIDSSTANETDSDVIMIPDEDTLNASQEEGEIIAESNVVISLSSQESSKENDLENIETTQDSVMNNENFENNDQSVETNTDQPLVNKLDDTPMETDNTEHEHLENTNKEPPAIDESNEASTNENAHPVEEQPVNDKDSEIEKSEPYGESSEKSAKSDSLEEQISEKPVIQKESETNLANNPSEELNKEKIESNILEKEENEPKSTPMETDENTPKENSAPNPTERQITLEDVELFPEDEEESNKSENQSNKNNDLSIEDFNLGESELNDLADKFVQDGWDI
uniref:CSON009544 protein n=1 Tax=Culicoides sonorensis TaxID=179676 RepID=A0A336LXI6_CULSO